MIKRIGKINAMERAIAIFLFVVLFLLIFFYYKSIMPYTYGDTAFLIESVSNMLDGDLTSRMLSQNAAEIKLAIADLSVYCQPGLIAAQFSQDPYDIASLHAYLILYLIAPFARMVGALATISAFTALAFASIPAIAYAYLRKQGMSRLVSVLAALICIAHPAWQISSNGQFYVDRWFIPLAMGYVIAVYHYFENVDVGIRQYRLIIFAIFIGVLGGMTSERNMLVIGIFSIGYVFLALTSIKKRLIILTFSIFCILYVYAYLQFVNGNSDTSNLQTGIFSIGRFLDAIQRPGLVEYLGFNLMLLVVSAVCLPRLFVAILPVVAINCLVTVGGAEKNGWATHYHSHYLGFLFAGFLISIGYLKKADSFRLPGRLIFVPPFLALILCAFCAASLSLYKGQGLVIALWDYYGRAPGSSSARAQKAIFDKLAQQVPKNSIVTSTEWGMAAWYLRGNTVNIFPVGVALSDYLMIQTSEESSRRKILAAVRYRSDVNLANECYEPVIMQRYDQISKEGSWALFKKKPEGIM